VPDANTLRSPAAVGDVIVTFRDRERTPDGTPHVPVSGNERDAPALSAGPPSAPAGPRVSTSLQGVNVKKREPRQEAEIGIDAEPEEPHPLPLVTVTFSVTLPLAPAENVIVRVPAPAVIVPFVIDQEYVAPAPASGTDAVWPVALGQSVVGAVISEEGSGFTVARVVAGADVHPATVAVTLYVPEAAGVAEAIEGFCRAEAKPLGPVHA